MYPAVRLLNRLSPVVLTDGDARAAAPVRTVPPAPEVPGPAASSSDQPTGRKRRSRRLLATTKTDEKAIAAPAIIGLSRPAAASGRAATL
ncbi:hypothetical protein GA0070624_1441 [Micromonospora rhizosphaerae]|uniref:Uncharacterized protein n=1 Tax=Micromonospora rhizosphaerae TaxID=568872 RepID=A0A1C6RLK4_9ACTN|nr:hypothetical protein GA0070624_1441 [Micromonospora rhizosphaerae]